MILGLQHVHRGTIGYGALGVGLEKALPKLGVEVSNPQLLPEEMDAGMLPKTNAIVWVTVPSHARGYWEGSNVWCFSMWEASRLPESFIECFDQFTGLIVPNTENLKQFSEFHDNVHLVPLGVDTDVWYVGRRKQLDAFMDFLICGAGIRKGTDLAVAAFKLAFPKPESMDPIPRLVMKNHKENYHASNILRISQRLSEEDLVALYRDCHVYLQPSRGEGWGLQPHQALALGMPTILSDIPGHQEYGWVPGARMIETTKAKSAYFIYGDAGDWWEPSLEHLIEQLRYTYRNFEDERDKARNEGAKLIAEQFSWANCAQGVIDAIGKDTLSQPYTGEGRWIPAPRRKYQVITRVDWTADIAGLKYFFRKGQVYYELADVKRILFEGGILDPACLVDDMLDEHGEPIGHGLADDQLGDMRAYSARFSTCSSCQHPLNHECPHCGRRCDE